MYNVFYSFHFDFRSKTQAINATDHAVGAIEKGREDCQTEDFQKDYEAVVKRHGYFGDFWTFKRCSVNGTMFHSEAYKKVTVRNNYTVQINEATIVEQFGSITRFFKVANPCRNASCFIKEKCSCICEVAYYAVVKQFDLIKAPAFHYKVQEKQVVTHIYPFSESER